MLNRFSNLSLKILRHLQVTQIASYYSVPNFVVLQKRTYVTATNEITKASSLNFIVTELKNRAKYKFHLSQSDLQSLLSKLQTERVNSAEALEILKCCACAPTEENLSAVVTDIWIELKNQNTEFQVQHYNYLLRFAKDKQDAQRAQEIFNEMKQDGIKPDAISYQWLLSAYCQCGNIEKATEICAIMDKENVNINEGSFNHLAECYIICGNIDAAKETMANLKARKFNINFRTLQILLSHYAKCGDIENIAKTFELFNEEKWRLLNHDILKVICELAVNGFAGKIEPLLPFLKSIKEGRPFQNAVTLFVKNHQSPIMPKILRSIDGEIRGMYKCLIQEMIRLSTEDDEFNETIANIVQFGMTKQVLESVFGEESEQLNQIQKHVEMSESPEQIAVLLKKLIAEQLAAKPATVEKIVGNVSVMHRDFTNEAQNTLEMTQQKDNNLIAADRHQFMTYIREENIEQVESLMSTGRILLSKSDCALLIDLYSRSGKLEKALNMMKRASVNNTTFKLNCKIVARLLALMIDREYSFRDIEVLLCSNAQYRPEWNAVPFHNIFKQLSDSGDVQLADKIFNALTKYGYIRPTPETAKLLILTHLKNKSFDAAVAKYEHFAIKYNFLTITMVFFVELIQHNEDDLVKRVFDLDKRMNNEYAASRRLASAYGQCGKHQYLREILEKFNAKTLSNFIVNECKQYKIFGRFKAIETLLDATEGLDCDRLVIYQHIFEIYEKQNKVQEILNLWRKFRIEDPLSTEFDFEKKIAKFLKSNNIEIPVELRNIGTNAEKANE